MTPQCCLDWYNAYRWYYLGKYDFAKYHGKPPSAQPILGRKDRSFFYRIAQKLNDAQIHALFTHGFFYHPSAYVTDMVTPDAFTDALTFAARAENGRTLLEHDLHTLQKHLATVNLDEWLYGEWMGDQRTSFPECLQAVVKQEISLDVACILFLVPRVEFGYNWTATMAPPTASNLGPGALGPAPWIDRLKKADMLIKSQRPGWRVMAWELSASFWQAVSGGASLAPETRKVAASLFA